MKDTSHHWPAISFLECLRPGPDESVDLALLASYSADLGTMGATLLALAGKDTDSGRGSPSDFAEAVERLRGKVRLVIQRGRLATMRRTPRVASVLDQFVREVSFDEAVQSWHPKVALVRFRNTHGATSWRLWLGSRNLTECANRDLGLLLVSGDKRGDRIPGVDDLARDLASRASLKGVRPATLASAIAKVIWVAPPGVSVEHIHWSGGSGRQTIPMPTENTTEIIVVSPFVDVTFLALHAKNGARNVSRTLLTTMSEIERVGPEVGMFDELLALDAPNYPAAFQRGEANIESFADTSSPPDDEEEADLGIGLHAKLLFMRTGRERRLWMGSANATMRAWTGRNAEVVAELLVRESVENGLKALLGAARVTTAPDLIHTPDDSEQEAKALEQARTQVAARWGATLHHEGERTLLTHHVVGHPQGPHPDAPDILLEVGSLHGELVTWSREQIVVDLGSMEAADRSEFVRLQIRRGDRRLSWLQRAPADPPFGEDRDRATFVRFLGSRGFFLWLGGLLADDGREGEGDWADDGTSGKPAPAPNVGADIELPTLEEMLAAWARDPARFGDIDRRISRYLPAILEQARHEEPQAAETLRSFEDLWRKIRHGLCVAATEGKHQ